MTAWQLLLVLAVHIVGVLVIMWAATKAADHSFSNNPETKRRIAEIERRKAALK